MKICSCWKTKRSKNKKKQPGGGRGEPSSPTLLQSSSSRTEESSQKTPLSQDEESPVAIQDEEQEGEEFLRKMKEIKLGELKESDKDLLSSRLDDETHPGITNWKSIAETLIGNTEDGRKTIEDISNGGNNPGSIFLRHLASLEIKLDDFFVKVKRQRPDLADYIKEEIENKRINPDESIGKLTLIQSEQIARKLNSKEKGVSGWRTFADLYEFDEVKKLSIGNGVEPCFSSTRQLFKYLPKHGIESLYDVYEVCHRGDLKNVFKEITEKLRPYNQ